MSASIELKHDAAVSRHDHRNSERRRQLFMRIFKPAPLAAAALVLATLPGYAADAEHGFDLGEKMVRGLPSRLGRPAACQRRCAAVRHDRPIAEFRCPGSRLLLARSASENAGPAIEPLRGGRYRRLYRVVEKITPHRSVVDRVEIVLGIDHGLDHGRTACGERDGHSFFQRFGAAHAACRVPRAASSFLFRAGAGWAERARVSRSCLNSIFSSATSPHCRRTACECPRRIYRAR